MSAWLAWLAGWGLPALLALWLLGALLASRGAWALRADRRARIGALALLALGAGVRLLFVPALAGHRYEGHEAEYVDIFFGRAPLAEGSTTLYPAMQAFWWALGQVLPRAQATPILVSTALGLGAGAALALALGWLGGARVGWAAAALLALHPAHAAWSGSAYNVIGPHALIALSLLAAARAVTGEGAPRPVLGQVAGAALGLAVAARVELGVVLGPLWLLAFARPGAARALWPPLLGGALLGLGAVAPLLAGGTPGEGERWLALGMNALWSAPYGVWGSAAGLLLLAAGAAAAWARWPRVTAALVGGGLLGHLALASFDDLGERHALALLPGLLWALAAGGAAFGWRTAAIPALAALLAGAGLVDLRGRYEGSEAAFSAMLARPPYDALPRWYLRRPPAPGRSPVDPRCGWVSEDERVSTAPLQSHFNLWDPEEAELLRGEGGCLHWCLDAADWRWSSRGVRDRALRMARLYELEPVAVVEEPRSGYGCLVMDVGRRRCCGPGLSLFAPRLPGRAIIP